MISKRQRKRIKKILPNYVQKTKEVLKNNGIVNKQGNPYSDVYIQYVFAGTRHNFEIEMAILEAYKTKLQELEDLEAEKEKLFQKK